MSNFEKSAKPHFKRLVDFLDKNRTSEGQRKYNYTSKVVKDNNENITFYPGTYNIDESNIEIYEEFITLYCNCIVISDKENTKISLTEKPQKYGPLRVDFDFHQPKDYTERSYTDVHLKEVVKYYQREIRNLVKDPNENKLYYCVVLEKKNPRVEKDQVKDGFHLHFPHFICDKYTDAYIRKNVIEQMAINTTWSDTYIHTQYDNMIDDIFTKPWMMYGSVNYKHSKSTPYLYNRWNSTPKKDRYGHGYDDNLNEISLSTIFEDELVGLENSVRYYLPRLLSIRVSTSMNDEDDIIHCTPITKTFNIERTSKPRTRKKINKNISEHSMEKAIEEITYVKNNLMGLLNSDRADEYITWIEIGMILYNISGGLGGDNDDGFPDESYPEGMAFNLWREFSERSRKYDSENSLLEYWRNFKLRDKGINSLKWLAKIDNPEQYRELQKFDQDKLLVASLIPQRSDAHYPIADLVCSIYGDTYINIGAKDKRGTWYEFKNHYWNKLDDERNFVDKIINNVKSRYHDYCSYNSKENEKEMTDSQLEVVKQRYKYAISIANGFGNVSFVNSVTSACIQKMNRGEFYEKLNTKMDILVCNNGVIDLETCTFRDGIQEDYASMTTNIDYDESLTEDDDLVKELNIFLRKIFPNERIRKYFIDIVSLCLMGGNTHKKFIIATGDGNNGKSVLFDLLNKVFGNYYTTMQRETLLKNAGSNAGAAREDIISLIGSRIAVVAELTDIDCIDKGKVKEFTGNDDVSSRGLYKSMIQFKPQHTLFMQCNAIPVIQGAEDDKAIKNRVRVVDFESTFEMDSSKVPKTIQEQYKQKIFLADTNIRTKLQKLAPAMLWKLFENYKKIKDKDLIEPEEVMSSTDRYNASNDKFRQYFGEKLRKVVTKPNEKLPTIVSTVLYKDFADWCSANYQLSKKDIPPKPIFINNMFSILGKPDIKNKKYGGFFGKQNKLYGYEIIEDDEDDEDD